MGARTGESQGVRRRKAILEDRNVDVSVGYLKFYH